MRVLEFSGEVDFLAVTLRVPAREQLEPGVDLQAPVMDGVITLALGFVGGLLYRFILKRLAKGTGRGRPQNIGVADRVVRAGFGVALLTLAITISWSPFLLFFSGFCFFEAMFSWCGFYAAIGKNTCPVE
jgi:hypothetical protein